MPFQLGLKRDHSPARQLERAALYARMSTDHQKYSLDNQVEVILAYARARDIAIVKTYIDAGRSGLSIEGRDALQQVLMDVCDGKRSYGPAV